LRDIGQQPQSVLALASAPDVSAVLMEETEVAKRLGIFGSPTFVVGSELFWGDDRLEDAISWYRHGRVMLSDGNSFTMAPWDIPEPDSLGG
jgi:hypothetical protein